MLSKHAPEAQSLMEVVGIMTDEGRPWLCYKKKLRSETDQCEVFDSALQILHCLRETSDESGQ